MEICKFVTTSPSATFNNHVTYIVAAVSLLCGLTAWNEAIGRHDSLLSEVENNPSLLLQNLKPKITVNIRSETGAGW